MCFVQKEQSPGQPQDVGASLGACRVGSSREWGVMRPPRPCSEFPELGAGGPRPCGGKIPALVPVRKWRVYESPASGDPKASGDRTASPKKSKQVVNRRSGLEPSPPMGQVPAALPTFGRMGSGSCLTWVPRGMKSNSVSTKYLEQKPYFMMALGSGSSSRNSAKERAAVAWQRRVERLGQEGDPDRRDLQRWSEEAPPSCLWKNCGLRRIGQSLCSFPSLGSGERQSARGRGSWALRLEGRAGPHWTLTKELVNNLLPPSAWASLFFPQLPPHPSLVLPAFWNPQRKDIHTAPQRT